MKGKYIAASMLLGATAFMAGRMSVGQQYILKVEQHTDTLVVRQPEVMVVHTIARDTVRLASAEVDGDSASVIVPRQQAEYSGEGYRAWVSGYRPVLDSIALEHITVTVPSAPKRWSIGLQAGIGLTPRGVQPYIGIGIAYNFKF